ncbi:MAG: 4Fe-4S dicluster domain-containing protein, partial [Candidatus Bathyarchaeia archaeon]
PGPLKPSKVHEWETGSFINLRLHHLFVTCYHCANPVCVDAANGALFKEPKYGAVLMDPEKSKSPYLRVAADACPYGAITFASDSPSAEATKCNMCIDRLEQNLMPTCVMACPNRALDFGPLEDLQKKYGNIASIEGLPDPSIVHPSVVFKPVDEPRKLVPYDETKALQLLAQRGDFPPVFNSLEDVTDVPDGLVGRSKLVLKPNGVSDPADTSVHDEG